MAVQEALDFHPGPEWKGESLREERGVGNINQFSSES